MQVESVSTDKVRKMNIRFGQKLCRVLAGLQGECSRCPILHGFAKCVYDVSNFGLGKRWKERNRQASVGSPLCHRQIALCTASDLDEVRLLVNCWKVRLARNTGVRQVFTDFVTQFGGRRLTHELHIKDEPATRGAGIDVRKPHEVEPFQKLNVPVCHSSTASEEFVNTCQLRASQGTLNIAQAIVVT